MARDDSHGASAPTLDEKLLSYRAAPRSVPAAALVLELLREARTVEAEEVCRTERAAGRDTTSLAVALATALLGQGRVREAATEAVKVLKQDPHCLPAHRVLGQALLLGGRAEMALDLLTRASQLHPADPWLELLRQRAQEACAASALSASPLAETQLDDQAAPLAASPLAETQLDDQAAPPTDRPLDETQLDDEAAPSAASPLAETQLDEAAPPTDRPLDETQLDDAAPPRAVEEEEATLPSSSSPMTEDAEDETLPSAPAPLDETVPNLDDEADVEATQPAFAADTARSSLPPLDDGSVEDLGDDGDAARATRPASDYRKTAESDQRQRELLERERWLARQRRAAATGSSRVRIIPEAPVVPTDEPRPRTASTPRYPEPPRPITVRVATADLEIVSVIRHHPPLSLEDSLQRAEAILDGLEGSRFPDSIVFAPPPGVPRLPSSQGLGEEPTLPISPDLARLLDGEPVPVAPPPPLAPPLVPGTFGPSGFPAPPTYQAGSSTPATPGHGDEPTAPHQPPPPAPPPPTPPRKVPPARATTPRVVNPSLAPLAPARPAPTPRPGHHGSRSRLSTTATRQWLSSWIARLGSMSWILWLLLPLLLLLVVWGGLLLLHEVQIHRLQSVAEDARRAAIGGAFGELLTAEEELQAAIAAASGQGLLGRLADRATGPLGRPRLASQHLLLTDELARCQALLVLHHGATRGLPQPQHPRPPGQLSPARRELQALVLLARGDTRATLELLPERPRPAEEPELLRLRATALLRSRQPAAAARLLNELPLPLRRTQDLLLLGQALEETSPRGALDAYLAAARLGPCPRCEVLRIRLGLRGGKLANPDRLRLQEILEDARRASPRDRALAAGVLARVAQGEGAREEARGLLKRALQLDPSDLSFGVLAARLDFEELALGRARGLLAQTLQSRSGCGECRILLAEVELARGDPAAALTALATETPATSRVFVLRGRALLLTDRLQEAADQLTTALSLQSDLTEAAALAAVVKVRQGNRRGGMEALRQLERTRGNDPEVLLALSLALRAQGLLDQARGYAQEAARLEPSSYRAATELCQIEVEAGFGGPARAACKQALARNPEHLPARRLLARIHAAEGRRADAETAYRQILEQLPDDGPARLGLLLVLVDQGKDEEAGRDVVQYSRQLGPSAALVRGLLAERGGHLEEAVRELTSATAVPGLTSRAATALGRVYLSLEREAQAQEQLWRATQEADPEPSAHLLLGDLALKADQPDRAVQSYGASLELLSRRLHRSEEEAAALYGLGEGYLRKGRQSLGAAQQAFERAATADPRDGSSRLRLAEIAELRGDEQAAIQQYRSALAVDANLVRCYWALGRLLARRGERTEAIRLLEEYLQRLPTGENAREVRELLRRLRP
ncbi:MAG: tetratricopeptide repeat protein [Myxococcota bacterium]|jgi:Tfp pilus assembly protein PilF|nr:tetratricopeptide repeat protein [Myxococcota bacterium]